MTEGRIVRLVTLWILGAVLVAPALTAQEGGGVIDDGVISSLGVNLRIVITADVFDELGVLADTLLVETVRCLIGLAQGDSILVDLAWQPPIEQSTPNSVAYRPCPVATIALWHNHLEVRDSEPEYSCYLSEVDIREAIRSGAPPMQMVQVTGGVSCWWTRSQVAEYAEAFVMRPLLQQSVGRFHLWSSLRCAPERERVVCSQPTG